MLAGVVTRSLSDEDPTGALSVPSLVAFVVAAVMAGLLPAILPAAHGAPGRARRAALRVNLTRGA